MRRFTQALALASLLGIPASLLVARPQDKSSFTVPFELKQHIILVKGTLCGEEGHTFVLDSGASETVITPAAAKKVGMGGGMMTQCPSVSAGEAVAKNLRVVIMDPPQARPLRQLGVDYSGILGQSYFAQFVATINYKKCEVTFVSADKAPKTEKDDKSFLVDFKLVNNIVIVEGKLNGKGPQTYVLDTGASETVITPDTAKDVGLKTEPAMTQMGRLEKGKVDSIQIGDAVVKGIEVVVWDPPQAAPLRMLGVNYNGILGFSYLSEFLVTLDYRQSQIKLAAADGKPSNGATGVRPGTTRELAGPLFGLKLKDFTGNDAKAYGIKSGGAVEVEDVAKATAAERAGFKKGDVITRVNGITVSSVEEFEKLASIAKIGDKLEVNVMREGGKVLKTFKLMR